MRPLLSSRDIAHRVGILYSAMPRGDMQGTVMFTDRTNRLCCEIQFGEIKVGCERIGCRAYSHGEQSRHHASGFLGVLLP